MKKRQEFIEAEKERQSKVDFSRYRIDLYIGPASVDWTSLTASKDTSLEDVMLGVEVWLENMNECQYK